MDRFDLRRLDYPDAETYPHFPNTWPCVGCWDTPGATGLSVDPRRIEPSSSQYALTRRTGYACPFESGYMIRQSDPFPDTNGYRQVFHVGQQHFYLNPSQQDTWLPYGYCRKIDLTSEKPYTWTGTVWIPNSTVWRSVWLRFNFITASNLMRVEVSIGNSTPAVDLTYDLPHDPTGTWAAFERGVATSGILEGWFSPGDTGPSFGPDFCEYSTVSRFAGELHGPLSVLPKLGPTIYRPSPDVDRWLPRNDMHHPSNGAYSYQWEDSVNGRPFVQRYSHTNLLIFRSDIAYNGTLNKFGFVVEDPPTYSWEGYYTADIPDTFALMDAADDNTITLNLHTTNFGTPPATITYRWRKLGSLLPPAKTSAHYIGTDKVLLKYTYPDAAPLVTAKARSATLSSLSHPSAYTTDEYGETLDDYPSMLDGHPPIPPLLWTASTNPYGEMAGAWTHSITSTLGNLTTDLRRLPWTGESALVAHNYLRLTIRSTNTDADGNTYEAVTEIPCSLIIGTHADPLEIRIEGAEPAFDLPYAPTWVYRVFRGTLASPYTDPVANLLSAADYSLGSLWVNAAVGGTLTLL